VTRCLFCHSICTATAIPAGEAVLRSGELSTFCATFNPNLKPYKHKKKKTMRAIKQAGKGKRMRMRGRMRIE